VLRVQTRVNGDLRQDATTDDLIFSIPYLIKTMSEGQTLMPGDVLATGTPAGVGIGCKPPIYLKPGDTVAISVNGLGTLTNRIADPATPNPIPSKASTTSHLQMINPRLPSSQLTQTNNKSLHYTSSGPENGSPVVFVHGLGGSTESFTPLIHTLGLSYTHSFHTFDLEGHGASPTHPLSILSIPSFAADLNSVFERAEITEEATIIAHSMGCLVAIDFAANHPEKVKQLILLGPPALPFPEEGVAALRTRAELVRREGMVGIADKIAQAGTSAQTQTKNPIAVAAVRMSLLGQDKEGYAKACTALADAEVPKYEKLRVKTVIVTGSEDGVAPVEACEDIVEKLNGKGLLEVLEGVGHWSVFEDLEGVAKVVENVLGRSSIA
jgi:pimeloyl-ACP methyl ester carboxylesterase